MVGHVCPEASEGGPIALVQDGDEILFDADRVCLDLCISDSELQCRRAAWAGVPEAVAARRKGPGVLAKYARGACSAHYGAGLYDEEDW